MDEKQEKIIQMKEEEMKERNEEKMRKKKEEREKIKEKKKEEKGMVIVNKGKGKGKQKEGLGMVLSEMGNGMKIGVVKLVKGQWDKGERWVMEKFKEKVKI